MSQLQQHQSWWPKIERFIHLVASITSVTGISLLVLIQSLGRPSLSLVIAVPVVFCATLLSFGIACLGFLCVRYGYQNLVSDRELLWKTIYFSFAVPLALVVLFTFGTLIWTYAVAIAQSHF
jgi:hypothetical protein